MNIITIFFFIIALNYIHSNQEYQSWNYRLDNFLINVPRPKPAQIKALIDCKQGFNGTIFCNSSNSHCIVNCTSNKWNYTYKTDPYSESIYLSDITPRQSILDEILLCDGGSNITKTCIVLKVYDENIIILQCFANCLIDTDYYSYMSESVWNIDGTKYSHCLSPDISN